MFGYVKPYKPDLRIREFEIYKSVYCSVCKSLGDKYGIVSRLLLSYDATFLALLMLAVLPDIEPKKLTKRCLCNPLKRCSFLKGSDDIFGFVSAFTVIVSCYKMRDDVTDSRLFAKIKARVILLVFTGAYKRASNEFSDLNSTISRAMLEQTKVERDENTGIDCSAHPTATMLSEIFRKISPDKDKSRVLREMGYYLGRWVYLIDAADDMASDLKHNNFNPLLREKLSTDQINEMLNITISHIIKAFELLSLNEFSPIVENVILSGLEMMQKYILFERNVKK